MKSDFQELVFVGEPSLETTSSSAAPVFRAMDESKLVKEHVPEPSGPVSDFAHSIRKGAQKLKEVSYLVSSNISSDTIALSKLKNGQWCILKGVEQYKGYHSYRVVGKHKNAKEPAIRFPFYVKKDGTVYEVGNGLYQSEDITSLLTSLWLERKCFNQGKAMEIEQYQKIIITAVAGKKNDPNAQSIANLRNFGLHEKFNRETALDVANIDQVVSVSNFNAKKLKVGDWFITKPKEKQRNGANVKEYRLKSTNNTVTMAIEKTPGTPGTVEHSFDYKFIDATYDGTKTSWVDNLTTYLRSAAPREVIDEFKRFRVIQRPDGPRPPKRGVPGSKFIRPQFEH